MTGSQTDIDRVLAGFGAQEVKYRPRQAPTDPLAPKQLATSSADRQHAGDPIGHLAGGPMREVFPLLARALPDCAEVQVAAAPEAARQGPVKAGAAAPTQEEGGTAALAAALASPPAPSESPWAASRQPDKPPRAAPMQATPMPEPATLDPVLVYASRQQATSAASPSFQQPQTAAAAAQAAPPPQALPQPPSYWPAGVGHPPPPPPPYGMPPWAYGGPAPYPPQAYPQLYPAYPPPGYPPHYGSAPFAGVYGYPPPPPGYWPHPPHHGAPLPPPTSPQSLAEIFAAMQGQGRVPPGGRWW
jgi:hypothetical protein